MLRLFFLLFFFSTTSIYSQSILKDANVIIVKGVDFKEVCNALLDSGYTIDKKDNDLQTASTEAKSYPKYWDLKYVVNIRIKDSSAYISGKIYGSSLINNEPTYNHCKKNGESYPKSAYGYPFILLNNFALGFKKEVSYSIVK
jgi:hypothetical protein